MPTTPNAVEIGATDRHFRIFLPLDTEYPPNPAALQRTRPLKIGCFDLTIFPTATGQNFIHFKRITYVLIPVILPLIYGSTDK